MALHLGAAMAGHGRGRGGIYPPDGAYIIKLWWPEGKRQ